MRPICVCGSTNWTMMIFAPAKVRKLGCVDRPTQEGVAKEAVGRIGAWCAGSNTGLEIASAR